MRYYGGREQTRGEKFLAVAPRVAGYAVAGLALGGVAWWCHETGFLGALLNNDPTHVTLQQAITGQYHTNSVWNADIIVNHVNGSSLTNFHHATTTAYNAAVSYPEVGNEYTIQEAGSNKVLNIILPDNVQLDAHTLTAGNTYDLQGRTFAELTGKDAAGYYLSNNNILVVDKVTVDNGSTGLVNSLASFGLTGGVIGAARGLSMFPRLN